MQSVRSSSPAAASTVVAATPPVALTRLIGRSRELAELEQLLDTNRLVTLTGVGGAGKSRLAAELSFRVTARKEIPATWIEFASCSDPLLIAQKAATAFNLGVSAAAGPLRALIDFIRDRELVIVMDNCEHVIDAAAELTRSLLTECARLTILATSREPMGIPGEQVWPVPPLAFPSEDDGLEAIASSEAVELFVDRARAANPTFGLTAGNSGIVARICRRLDGIPLAIELAAARVRLLTPEQIAERLNDRFALLSGTTRTSVARHRTLRATIDWSYTLLNEAEQRLLERLAVFAGPFSLESIEAVCSDTRLPRESMLDLLGSLVDKSLVSRGCRAMPGRYSLLETIGSYATERLEQRDDSGAWRRRHAEAVLALARDCAPELMNGSMPQIERLDEDCENIRAALAWSIEEAPDEIALPLAASLRWYWYYGIRWTEAVRWLTRVLERAAPGLSPDRAAVLTCRGTLSGYLGDLAAAKEMLLDSERQWREIGDRRQLAFNLTALAHVATSSGDLETASRCVPEAVELARSGGVGNDIAYCLTNGAAFVAQAKGDFDEADRHLAEAEEIWAKTKSPLGLPFVLSTRALLAVRRGDPVAAARFAHAALLETRERGELWFSSRALRVLAFTAADDPHRAARLLGAADCMLRTMTLGMLAHEKREHERLLASLHEKLTREEFDRALHDGRTMTFEEACDLAFEGNPARLESAAAESKEPNIVLRDLGPLQISIDGRTLDGEARASARALEMLLFLIANPSGCTKEEVGVALWPDASAEQIKNSFHVTLHRLRKMLGRPDVVASESGRYRVDAHLRHAATSRRFESAINVALRRNEIAGLESALELYEGDFLQGEEVGEWAIPIRSQLRQLFLRGLFALGQAYESRGRYDEASAVYQRITSREPFHEAAWRRLMVCRSRLGARSESLLLFRDLEQRLKSELETVPEPETMNLYRRLQQNETV